MAPYNRQSKRGLRFPSRLVNATNLLALCVVGLIPTARAQQPGDVVRVRTDLVAVPVIVTDPRGRRVSDLQATDFALRDDRGALKIDYFASGTERVALLLADLAPLFQAIERDLRGQYVIGFYPGKAARDAISHPLEVSLTSPQNRKLRIHELKSSYTLKDYND